ALDRLGLRARTIVAFIGDHGYHLGEKGKWSKHQSLFDTGLRVPLLIQAPGARANGKPCGRIVQALDLYPTLAELAGLPSVAGLHGHSLTPLLADPGAAWEHPAFSVAGSRAQPKLAVRTDRWRYAEFPGAEGGAMLLDEQADPHETKNLAADPAHAGTVKAMRELLKSAFPAKQ
nr:sulfatase-like hydrolase/transferase [Verrucomicrobiota bacterium]